MTHTSVFEPLLTPPAAAELLIIHEKTLIRMARHGEVPALRLGKHWRFRASDLQAWVTEKSRSKPEEVLHSAGRSA
jgi:excisionase family DNA binding protein